MHRLQNTFSWPYYVVPLVQVNLFGLFQEFMYFNINRLQCILNLVLYIFLNSTGLCSTNIPAPNQTIKFSSPQKTLMLVNSCVMKLLQKVAIMYMIYKVLCVILEVCYSHIHTSYVTIKYTRQKGKSSFGICESPLFP